MLVKGVWALQSELCKPMICCRYNTTQYNMIFCTEQLWRRQNIKCTLAKDTHNYGVSIVRIWEKIDCVYNKANLRDLIAATGLVISNWIQIVNFSARVTVKFDGWPCNTIGHLFYATSSFVHHFVAIGEFKLQLQSGNAQSGSNATIFRGVRPWNLTADLAIQ